MNDTRTHIAEVYASANTRAQRFPAQKQLGKHQERTWPIDFASVKLLLLLHQSSGSRHVSTAPSKFGAMSRLLRLEWTRCADGANWTEVAQSLEQLGPEMWEPLPMDAFVVIQEIDEAPGWYIPAVFLTLPGGRGIATEGLRLLGHIWVYKVEFVHNNDHDDQELFSDGTVAVREVPPCLVFNCSLAVFENRYFRAVFTNLAGNEVLRLEEDLPRTLTVGHLICSVRCQAHSLGFLQSFDQEVKVLLNGAVVEFCPHIVLWNMRHPVLSQRRLEALCSQAA
jgi:hypothetical protein